MKHDSGLTSLAAICYKKWRQNEEAGRRARGVVKIARCEQAGMEPCKGCSVPAFFLAVLAGREGAFHV